MERLISRPREKNHFNDLAIKTQIAGFLWTFIRATTASIAVKSTCKIGRILAQLSNTKNRLANCLQNTL